MGLPVKKYTLGIALIWYSIIYPMQTLQEAVVTPLSVQSLHRLLSNASLLKDYRDTPQNVLMQAEVLNQFIGHGSTPASCGYHSFNNGLLLASAAQSGSIEFLRRLTSIQVMAEKLDEWRLLVNMKRLKKRSTDYLTGLLMTYYKGVSSLELSLFQRDAFERKVARADANFESTMKAKVLSVIRTLCCQDLLKEEVDSFSCSVTKESLYETYCEVMMSNSQRSQRPRPKGRRLERTLTSLSQGSNAIGLHFEEALKFIPWDATPVPGSIMQELNRLRV